MASRVRELVIVTGVWFVVNVPSSFRFYAKGLTQDTSQLVGQVVRIHARLDCCSRRHHVNWSRPKRKLRRGLIAKAVNFWLVVGIEPHRVVVGVIGQEAQ
jgi:hypothetical protein